MVVPLEKKTGASWRKKTASISFHSGPRNYGIRYPPQRFAIAKNQESFGIYRYDINSCTFWNHVIFIRPFDKAKETLRMNRQ